MTKILKLAKVAAIAAAVTVSATATSMAKDLPDLLILDKGEGYVTKLRATGKCDQVSALIVGDVVIKNSGKGRAKPLAISPLISAFDLKDPSFKDDDRKLNSLAPGETQKTRIRIGMGKNKKGMQGWRKIRIIADPKDKIDETKEKNNTYDVWVKVNCGY